MGGAHAGGRNGLPRSSACAASTCATSRPPPWRASPMRACSTSPASAWRPRARRTTNLVTGIAHAWADCTPVLALGGAAPVSASASRRVPGHRPARDLQADHQMGRPRATIRSAFPSSSISPSAQAMTGKPGPVYLDLPGDILYQEVDENEDRVPRALRLRASAPAGGQHGRRRRRSSICWPRPSSRCWSRASGVQWSEADDEMLAFVEAAGIPFYTTPQGRGVIPEDHKYSLPHRAPPRSAMPICILVVGTRMNYVIGHAAPPRWNANAKIVRIDIDPERDRVQRRAARRRRRRPMPRSPWRSSPRRIKGKVTPASYEAGASGCAPATCRKTPEAEQALSTNAVADPSAAAVQGSPRLHGPRRACSASTARRP